MEENNHKKNPFKNQFLKDLNFVLQFLLKKLDQVSVIFDRIILDKSKHHLIALLLAVFVMFSIYNHKDQKFSLWKNKFHSSLTVDNVKVNVLANTNSFEISGVPEVVSATFVGDLTDLQYVSSNSNLFKVNADLRSLGEGTHNIRLVTGGVGGVKTLLEPSNILVTIKRKVSKQFPITYDYLNTYSLEPSTSLEAPVFDTETVVIKASESKLKEVNFVKVLVDAALDENKVQKAKVVAYNFKGEPMDVDIIPKFVDARFKVTKLEKEVPINLYVKGELSDKTKAIASAKLNRQTVFFYAPKNVLDSYHEAQISLPLDQIVSNSRFVVPIVKYEGLYKMSHDSVSVDVELGKKEQKVLRDVNISYINNDNKYRLSVGKKDNAKTSVDVTIFGTKENLEQVTTDNVKVFIDVQDIKNSGKNVIKLQAKSENPLVQLKLSKTEIEINAVENQEKP